MIAFWIRRIGVGLPLIAGIVLVACAENPQSPAIGASSLAVMRAKAKPTSGPAVASATPSYGKRGETKVVQITGTGFEAGATVAWERSGISDPDIAVVAATVVSSTRIDVTITIGSDAELAFYDISVTNTSRKKGVGTELFEVTTATSIGTLGGNTNANAANDNVAGVRVVGWSLVGSTAHAFAWPGSSGQMIDLGPGDAQGVDQLGTTVAGTSGGHATVWESSSGSWSQARLPLSTSAPSSRVEQLASGPDGAALYIVGSEDLKVKNATYQRPAMWKRATGVWEVKTLEMPQPSASASAWLLGVNGLGHGAGIYRLFTKSAETVRPVFWDEQGRATLLPVFAGGGGGGSGGVNADGTVLAGTADGRAAYWTAVVNGDGSRTWSGPFILPGDCGQTVAISEAGRIVGRNCVSGGGSAVFDPPYTTAAMTYLRGLGDKADEASAWGISPAGSLIVGTAKPIGSSHRFAVIWDSVLF